MAIDPRDLGELQRALNDASGRASALWTTFVTFALYLVIAFGSVTHRDLLLESPVRLPLLNVDLPLTAFFAVAPTVFVVFHFYILLQLFSLARKVADYNTLLRASFDQDDDRQMLRQRIDAFPVTQFLAGPQAQRVGLVGVSLRFIGWVTLVGAPVAVLLVAQLTFLAYHSELITWVQRLCLVTDLGLIWFFWKRIRGGGDRSWPRFLRWLREGLSVAMTVAVTGFSLVVAYFPGEAVERRLDRLPFGLGAERAGVRWLNAALFDADVPSGRRVAVLSNRLVLANQRFTLDAVGGRPPLGRSLRDRDLNHAVFDRSDLTGADFSGADLSHARFVEATLDGAKFYSANLSDVRAQFARLSNANLTLAILKNARLLHANLVGARFTGSTLDLAHLGHSNLSGATFYSATLPGVRFSDAMLDGAVFRDTDLRGASFAGARLRGADFVNSCLSLADFRRRVRIRRATPRNS